MAQAPKLLIITGSHRKRGNSELLARVVAQELSERRRIDSELLRLTDFSIAPCRGCLTCIVNQVPCVIDDDAAFVHGKMEEADGILFCMPVYEFSPPAIFKLLLDRQYSTVVHGRIHHKKAAVIAVGTMRTQGLLVGALFDLYMKSMLLQPVGTLVFGEAYGPGSILLNRDAVDSSIALGEKLVDSLHRNMVNECPLCALQIVALRDDVVICPLCGKGGRLSVDGIKWNENRDALSFDSHAMAEMFAPGAWTTSTIARYRKEVGTIVAMKEQYGINRSTLRWVTRRIDGGTNAGPAEEPVPERQDR